MKTLSNVKNVMDMVTGKGIINGLALLMVVGSVNSACTWILHQPVVPKAADRFKKHNA